MHLSVYSHLPELQAHLTGNPGSFRNIRRSLENAGRRGLDVTINTVIN